MKEINTKFGKMFIEEWDYNNNCPAIREEEDRVKIFDSNENYLDYFMAETVEEVAQEENITPQEMIDKHAEKLANANTIEDLLDMCDVEYDLITKDKKEVVKFLLDFNVDDDNDVDNNDYVNKIGDYYIIVSEI